MNLALERVIYVSQATRPDPEILLLADILATSDRNNQRDRLSGALVVTADRFLQVLEGRVRIWIAPWSGSATTRATEIFGSWTGGQSRGGSSASGRWLPPASRQAGRR